MKYLMLLLVAAGVGIIAYVFLSENKPAPLHIVEEHYTPHETSPALTYDQALVRDINARNATVTSFRAAVQGEVRRRVKVQIAGDVFYEKPKNARFILGTRFGTELDLGSNATHFWFWSRRLQPRALYYARHEDVDQTRLKPGLHPLWVIQALNLDEIVVTPRTKLEEYRGNLRVVNQERAVNGTTLRKCALIDRQRKVVIGHYLFNPDGSLVTSVEFEEFVVLSGVPVPSKAQIIWQEPGERVVLAWVLSGHQANVRIPADRFRMPDLSPAVDMARD